MAHAKLGVLLFGAGRIGQIHAATLASHSGVKFLGVCDPVRQSAEKLAAEFGVPAFTEAEEAFGQESLEAVIISSPTGTHLDLMLRASRRGLAAFCEKPIDLDLSRVRVAQAELEGTASPLMMGFNRRFDPHFTAVRDRIASGEIGRLEQLTIVSRDPAPSPKEYIATSGGIFLDMTIHDFDTARYFVPEIVELSAFGANAFSDEIRAIDDFDSAVVIMRGSGEELITIMNSRHCSFGYDQRIEAFGSNGMLVAENVRPTTVLSYSGSATGAQDPNENFFLERYGEAYRFEVEAFIDALMSGRPCSPSFADGVKALELAQAAAESAATGKSIHMGGAAHE